MDHLDPLDGMRRDPLRKKIIDDEAEPHLMLLSSERELRQVIGGVSPRNRNESRSFLASPPFGFRVPPTKTRLKCDLPNLVAGNPKSSTTLGRSQLNACLHSSKPPPPAPLTSHFDFVACHFTKQRHLKAALVIRETARAGCASLLFRAFVSARVKRTSEVQFSTST